MKQQTPPISSSEGLARFVFEQMGVRWRVSEHPVLTMHEVFEPYSNTRTYQAPVWLWTITLFVPDEAGQPLEGRVLRVQQEQDRRPDEDTVVHVFGEVAYLISTIWDSHHSRCYGYLRWKLNEETTLPEREAIKQYHREKALILAARALLGRDGFRELLRADL